MDKVKQTLTKYLMPLKAKLDAVDTKVKVGVLAGIAVIVIALIIFSIIMGQTGFSTLYSGISTTESAEIVEYCRDTLGVADIRINSNGDILVPEEKLEEIRVELSIQGYPKSAYNYDIWNNGVDMFSTQSEILEVQKQQLESNLVATLRKFENVNDATVILTIPESSDYVISDSAEESRASVQLQLRDELDEEEIQGIYNLVRNSVPGLEEENIAITDGTGKPLVGSLGDSVGETEEARLQLYYERLDYKGKMEGILETGLKDVMQDLYSDFNVTVALELNYDDKVTEKTEYTPSVSEDGTAGGMISNETNSSEVSGTAVDGGIVGTSVDADISEDYPTLTIAEDGEVYVKKSQDINYLVNTEKTQIEKNGYSIDKLTAAVTVSSTTLTADEEDKLKRLIAASIGTDLDSVSIFAKPFNITNGGSLDEDELNVTTFDNSNAILLAVIIVLGVVLIVLLVLALTASGSKKKRQIVSGKRAVAAIGPSGGSSSSDEFDTSAARVSPASARNAIEDSQEAFELHSLSEDVPETRDIALKREIRDFSKSNPEIVAQLIRTWMREE